MKKVTKKQTTEKMIIYQTASGALEIKADIKQDTFWLTQAQISQVFAVERSVITKHILKILKDKEVVEKSNVQKMHIANSDKPVAFYSLDIVLAVGYRTNSGQAIAFRQWATKTLKQHLVQGYTINKKVILKNYDHWLKTVADVQSLLPTHVTLDPHMVLELVKEYSVTWAKLDAYDKDALTKSGSTKKRVKLSGDELGSAIQELKQELLKKKEATDIFAHERQAGNIVGIVGNVMQSFGGNDVYLTLEEKAAHLLYFMVKNHPFTDGNKRSGAFAFIWFLRKYRVGGATNINPSGLTAMTLLIAESDPKQKERVVALVVELLRVNKK